MKRIAATLLTLSSLLCVAPAKAVGCENSLSFVILSSGECQVLSGDKPVKPVKSIPFSFTRVRLKGADNPNLLIVAGQITNQGDKVYRNVLITVQIGANRLEEVLIPGLISPGQTRKFESFIERDRTSVRNPVYVQEVKYSER